MAHSKIVPPAIGCIGSAGAVSAAVAESTCPATTDAASELKCIPQPAPAVDSVPDVNALRAPETPAFHALGLGSEDIQRPATPFSTTMAVASGLANGKLVVPFQNVGMEFAPYWMQRCPDVTREYMESHKSEAWYRNFTVSLAFTHDMLDARDETGAVSEQDTALGAIGMRTSVWPGEPSDIALECQSYLLDHAQQDVFAIQKEQLRKLAK